MMMLSGTGVALDYIYQHQQQLTLCSQGAWVDKVYDKNKNYSYDNKQSLDDLKSYHSFNLNKYNIN